MAVDLHPGVNWFHLETIDLGVESETSLFERNSSCLCFCARPFWDYYCESAKFGKCKSLIVCAEASEFVHHSYEATVVNRLCQASAVLVS